MVNNYTNLLLQQYGYTGDINPDYSTPQLLQYHIGIFGAPNCDFNFAADAATHNQQNLDLGLIIPYQWHITHVIVECIEAVAGVADFGVSVGLVSAAENIVPYTLCAGLGSLAGSAIIPDMDNSIINRLFFGGDPTSLTWDDMASGRWLLSILLNDFSKL